MLSKVLPRSRETNALLQGWQDCRQDLLLGVHLLYCRSNNALVEVVYSLLGNPVNIWNLTVWWCLYLLNNPPDGRLSSFCQGHRALGRLLQGNLQAIFFLQSAKFVHAANDLFCILAITMSSMSTHGGHWSVNVATGLFILKHFMIKLWFSCFSSGLFYILANYKTNNRTQK